MDHPKRKQKYDYMMLFITILIAMFGVLCDLCSSARTVRIAFVAVVTNSIPSTGVPLPFISYGGTASAIMMAEMGLVLGVSAQTKMDY